LLLFLFSSSSPLRLSALDPFVFLARSPLADIAVLWDDFPPSIVVWPFLFVSVPLSPRHFLTFLCIPAGHVSGLDDDIDQSDTQFFSVYFFVPSPSAVSLFSSLSLFLNFAAPQGFG